MEEEGQSSRRRLRPRYGRRSRGAGVHCQRVFFALGCAWEAEQVRPSDQIQWLIMDRRIKIQTVDEN
jgi:hypothetical protein